MRQTGSLPIVLFLAMTGASLTGCSQGPADESVTASADRSAPAQDSAIGEAARDSSPLGAIGAIPVSLPRMAYVYDYGFRLPGERIAALQQKHADMCEAAGPYVCQIVSMNRAEGTDDHAGGMLQLAVVSDKARAFGGELARAAAGEDGEQISATIAGEDLSRQLVDTEARLRSRIVLRDRLMEVLATRTGKVAELVEAERGVAQVNEEIDQAQSWLAEMRGRVAFSRVEITYEATGAAFLEPIRGAVGALGGILGTLAAALLVGASVLGPVALAILGLRRARQRWFAQVEQS